MREGWEKTNDLQLYAIDVKQVRRYAHLAKDLAKHPSHPVAVEHVRLFDSEQALMREETDRNVSGDCFS